MADAAWLDWASQAVSEKIVLVDMDIGRLQEAWYNARSSVWGHKFFTFKNTSHALGQGNLGYGSLGGSGTFESGSKSYPRAVGSAVVDNTNLTEQGSLASVQTNINSYWYDFDTSNFYIHCADHNDPAIFTVVLGLTMALSNKAIHINGGYYEPRLLGIPTLSKTKDPLFFGIIKHDGGAVELDNHDGFFDSITDDFIFGRPIEIRYGGNYHDLIMPFANYRQVFTGHIENSTHTWETFSVDAVHNIKRLARTIPVRKYNQTDFTDLHDDDLGKPRPISYGQIYHAEVVCTNKDAGSGPWTFEVADTTDHASGIMSVTTVYKDGVSIAIDSQSVAGGTVNVADANYKPLATDRGSVWTADFSGYQEGGAMITNCCDVIKDLNAVYADIPFASATYNVVEWDAQAVNALDCALYINDELNIEDAIEQLSLSSFGDFIEIDDGRFTFRIIDLSAPATETIGKSMISGSPSAYHDGTLFLSSCKIGYKKDWSRRQFRWLNENDEEDDIATKSGRRSEEKFETLLTNTTDAQTLANRFMAYYGKIRPDVTIMVPIEYSDFEIGDIKNFDTSRFDGTPFLGTITVEIIEITKHIGVDGGDSVGLTGLVI